MDPREINISDYSYHLPAEKIALYPLEQRDASKLLVFDHGAISDHHYFDLPSLIPNDAVLVFNETRVIAARLLFTKHTGGVIEIFCLEHHSHYHSVQEAMEKTGEVIWNCMVGGASKWKHSQVLMKEVTIDGNKIVLNASYEGKAGDNILVRFSWTPANLSFAEILNAAGQMPLPPYIKRAVEEGDRERYQTVFSREEGSVAAPTAGLHFTPELIKRIEERNIQTLRITLHVGAGTFKPVKTDRMSGHQMHGEYINVSLEAIEKLCASAGKPIIPVGTTSLRTIESLYWLGVQCYQGRINSNIPTVSQWEPYDQAITIDTTTALRSLVDWLRGGKKKSLTAKTEIIISPGYSFKIATGLISNFHQPNSTLLLLVAAMIGPQWKNVYEHALNNGYRFLSYGDGCLLFSQVD